MALLIGIAVLLSGCGPSSDSGGDDAYRVRIGSNYSLLSRNPYQAPALSLYPATRLVLDSQTLYWLGSGVNIGTIGGPIDLRAFAYHLGTGEWTEIAPLPSAEIFYAAFALNGLIDVIYGDWLVRRYDPEENAWETLAASSVTEGLSDPVAAATLDGAAYLVSRDGATTRFDGTAWTALNSPGIATALWSVGTAIGGKLYVAFDSEPERVWTFDPALGAGGTWTDTPVSNFLVDGALAANAGFNDGALWHLFPGTDRATRWSYNPAAGTLTSIAVQPPVVSPASSTRASPYTSEGASAYLSVVAPIPAPGTPEAWMMIYQP